MSISYWSVMPFSALLLVLPLAEKVHAQSLDKVPAGHCITDVKLAQGPNEFVYLSSNINFEIGNWDVDGAGAADASQTLGSDWVNLSVTTGSMNNFNCVEDIKLTFSSAGGVLTAPSEKYVKVGHWDVDDGKGTDSYGVQSDNIIGLFMTKMTKDAPPTQVVTNLWIDVWDSKNPADPERGFTSVGNWDVDDGGGRGTHFYQEKKCGTWSCGNDMAVLSMAKRAFTGKDQEDYKFTGPVVGSWVQLDGCRGCASDTYSYSVGVEKGHETGREASKAHEIGASIAATVTAGVKPLGVGGEVSVTATGSYAFTTTNTKSIMDSFVTSTGTETTHACTLGALWQWRTEAPRICADPSLPCESIPARSSILVCTTPEAIPPLGNPDWRGCQTIISVPESEGPGQIVAGLVANVSANYRCEWDVETAFESEVIKKVSLKSNDSIACRKTCEAEGVCLAWTLDEETHECILHSSQEQRIRKAKHTSGIVIFNSASDGDKAGETPAARRKTVEYVFENNQCALDLASGSILLESAGLTLKRDARLLIAMMKDGSLVLNEKTGEAHLEVGEVCGSRSSGDGDENALKREMVTLIFMENGCTLATDEFPLILEAIGLPRKDQAAVVAAMSADGLLQRNEVNGTITLLDCSATNRMGRPRQSR